jgi:hypothetical protein
VFSFESILYTIVEWTIPLLAAVLLHEMAHEYAAWRLGGDSALAGGPRPIRGVRSIFSEPSSFRRC